jgi:hypothetical protein
MGCHLAERFQRKHFFRNQPIRNKNCLWWPCLLMDQDKMSNLYRGPFTDASYQVSVHLAKRLEDKIFRNRPWMFIGWSSTNCTFFVLWEVLCYYCSFRPDPLTNMAALWNIFPIGSNVKLSAAVAAILNFIPEQKTQSLQRTIQWTFMYSLALIIFVVSEKA